MRYSLIYRGKTIPLGRGSVVLGRSAACKVPLDGDHVSRRHARLVIDDDGVVVKDLGSLNGVNVNGQRIDSEQRLQEGDRIEIGDHDLVVAVEQAAQLPRAPADVAIENLHDDEDQSAYLDGFNTARREVVSLAATAAAQLIEAGDADGAERILSPMLRGMLSATKRTKLLHFGAGCTAARQALELARATGRAEWVDYVFELHQPANRVLPAELQDDLEATVAEVGPIDAGPLSAYVDALSNRRRTFRDDELPALERLEDLADRIRNGQLADGDADDSRDRPTTPPSS